MHADSRFSLAALPIIVLASFTAASFMAGCGDEAVPNLNDGGSADAIVVEDTGGSDPDGSTAPDANPDDDAAANDDATATNDDATPGQDAETDGGTVTMDSGPTDGGSANANDIDCDGLSDSEEATFGTDPVLSDSDRDGIIDGVEAGRAQPVPGTSCGFIGDADPATTTNPALSDSDSDGIIDGLEDRDRNGRIDPTELDPANNDTDGDQLADGTEDRNRNGVRDPIETDGTIADTDGDAIDDGIEDLNRSGFLDAGESSPLYPDSDFDGLPDGIEDANHNGAFDPGETRATSFDTDGDTLRDGCEDRNQNGTVDVGEPDPRARDTDLDGLEDSDEDLNGNCILDPNETDAASGDTDCDGLSDLTELVTVYAGGQRSNPLLADTDADLVLDGVEGGATAIVPSSPCMGVLFDLDPPSRTNPTLSDTDGDARSDGCEDQNRNGRVDPNEMNPNALDTDGDGLLDNQEDTNGNCVRNGNESSAANADTDGDGIGDGVEGSLGTNPRVNDTDGDGIPDGIEDSNQNGVVDPNETNPLDNDTDGDGINDGVEDANRNGVVDPGETDPRNADTDGDGVSDSAEGPLGTSPIDSDSDNDGISDGDEIPLGTNPTDSDSDNDTVLDGDEVIAGTNPLNPNDPNPQGASGINAVCSVANLKVVQFNDDAPGDWQVALETSHTYTPLTVTRNDHAAAFDDSALGVSGFVVEMSLPTAGTTNPVTQAQALIARLTGGTAALNASAVTVQNNGRQITSHDGFGAVVDIRVNITLNAALNASGFRNRVLGVISAHALGNFGGLPGPGGGASSTYVLKFESLVRTGTADRVIAIGAITNTTNFANNGLLSRQQVEDVSNGTALARAYATHDTGCDPFPVTRIPQADFIWMADVSGSTDNDRGTIATAAATIFQGLQNNGVDFRMGVVPHFENHFRTGSVATAGDLRSGFTTSQTTFINDLNNTTNTDGCEFGLTAADEAIQKALPRSAPGVTNATKLRANAQLVVFYISDEHAQELEQNQCTLGNLGTGLTDIFSVAHEQNPPTAAQQTVIDGIVAPFVTTIQANDGIAFAQLHPLQAPFCFVDFPADEEEGYGYFEAVAATGGTFYRVCDSNPGAVLTDIIDAVSGAASEFILTDTPISATIKVGLTRNGQTTTTIVPRSAADGFDYDAGANTVFFRGAGFRPAVGDRVTISYRIFGPPNPPVICAPPLVLNPVTNTCECPVDCAVSGGCGLGFICNRDPGVCACFCEADCGGQCGGSTVCNVGSCSCVCAPNCGGTCNNGRVCNQASCTCACPSNCGGACTGRQVCDTVSCACTCPADCGGCSVGQRCDPVACACVADPL